jgi:hypothetical protein
MERRRAACFLCAPKPPGYFRFGASFLVGAASLVLTWAATDQKPDGRAVLMRMADYLSKAPAWNVTLHTAYDTVQPDGFKIEWNEIRNVTLSRPDRLRVEGERSDGARTLVLFNGKEITTYDESAHVYAQTAHPGTVDDAVVFFVHNLGMRLPLALMLLDRMPAELQQRVQTVAYVESTDILGSPAYHIAGKAVTVDFQLWIEKGEQPLPIRAVMTYKNAPGQPQFRADFSDWKLNIEPPDSLFAFTPPEGAKKIPFAATLLGIVPARQGSASRMRQGSASRMKGEKP